MGPAAAPAVSAAEPMSDAEHAAAVEDVTTLPPKREFTIDSMPLRVKPLTLRYAKALKAVVDPIAVAIDEVTNGPTPATTKQVLNLGLEIADGYTKAFNELLGFYSMQKSIEWIEEHMDASEVKEIIQAQLDVTRDHEYLLLGLRQTLLFAASSAALGRQLTQAQAKMVTLLETDSSSQASATLGTAPSTTSSPDTPEGS